MINVKKVIILIPNHFLLKNMRLQSFLEDHGIMHPELLLYKVTLWATSSKYPYHYFTKSKSKRWTIIIIIISIIIIKKNDRSCIYFFLLLFTIQTKHNKTIGLKDMTLGIFRKMNLQTMFIMLNTVTLVLVLIHQNAYHGLNKSLKKMLHPILAQKHISITSNWEQIGLMPTIWINLVHFFYLFL